MHDRAEQRTEIPVILGSGDGGPSSLTFRRGACVVQEGEEIRGVYSVIAGRASLMKKDDDGRLHDAGTIVVGDIIGMPEILNDKYYSATAVAEMVTSVSFIPKKEFLEMVRRDPSIILRSMKRVCERIAELERKIEGVA